MWLDRAACRELPPDWWDGGAPYADQLRAVAVCASCPVARECYADAVATGSVGVIRAGRLVGHPGDPRAPLQPGRPQSSPGPPPLRPPPPPRPLHRRLAGLMAGDLVSHDAYGLGTVRNVGPGAAAIDFGGDVGVVRVVLDGAPLEKL